MNRSSSDVECRWIARRGTRVLGMDLPSKINSKSVCTDGLLECQAMGAVLNCKAAKWIAHRAQDPLCSLANSFAWPGGWLPNHRHAVSRIGTRSVNRVLQKSSDVNLPASAGRADGSPMTKRPSSPIEGPAEAARAFGYAPSSSRNEWSVARDMVGRPGRACPGGSGTSTPPASSMSSIHWRMSV